MDHQAKVLVAALSVLVKHLRGAVMSARTVVMPTKHITDLMLSQIEICKKLTILAIFLWLPVSIFAISKRAVIIGLGQYQDKTWSTIHGDRDVPIVKKRRIGQFAG